MADPAELVEKKIRHPNLTSGAGHDTSPGGISLSSPTYNVVANDHQLTAQLKSINSEFSEDTYYGEYADENDQIETDTEFTINNPNFDPETMRETMPNSQFRGPPNH